MMDGTLLIGIWVGDALLLLPHERVRKFTASEVHGQWTRTTRPDAVFLSFRLTSRVPTEYICIAYSVGIEHVL